MAHVQKNTRAATGHLFDHYGRNAEDEKYKYLYRQNDSIDPKRTHLNYNLAFNPDGKTQQEIFDERMAQLKCLKRKDVNVMCSWVITVPKDLDSKRTKEFMKNTYDFLEERYGKKNVISAYVHMDETTPHMHFAFIPVVYDEKKHIEKVCAKDVINRYELQTFHEDLQNYLEKNMKCKVNILNDATKEGNKSIEELKRGTARQTLHKVHDATKREKEELNHLQRQKSALQREIEALKDLKRIQGNVLSNQQIKNIKTENPIFDSEKVKISRNDFINLQKSALMGAQAEQIYKSAMAYLQKAEKILEQAEDKRKEPIKETMERMMLKKKLEDYNKALDKCSIEVKRTFENALKTITAPKQREHKTYER